MLEGLPYFHVSCIVLAEFLCCRAMFVAINLFPGFPAVSIQQIQAVLGKTSGNNNNNKNNNTARSNNSGVRLFLRHDFDVYLSRFS